MTTSIVFIDSRVANYQALVASLGAETEWFLLDANRDGVGQMKSILGSYSGLAALQVISHGSSGALYLGNAVLHAGNLRGYEGQLGAIGSSLEASGDILLYGCDVAQGDVGLNFIKSLAQLTGADVAASDDLTGAGGDWNLEAASGLIEAVAISGETYASALNVIKGTDGNDTLTGDGLDNVMYGYGGDDRIDGEAGHDLIEGGDGDDAIDGNFGNDAIYGGRGNDVLTDSQGSSQMYGGDGDDQLKARTLAGDHTLDGGLGNDRIEGVGATMALTGGDGNDFLFAHGDLSINRYVQQGRATLSGGAGDDDLQSGALSNVLIEGGDGSDALSVSNSKTARLEGGAGADVLVANADGYSLAYIGEVYGVSYQLDGGADDDSLEVSSSAFKDWGRIDLSLEGGGGNDTLKVSTSRAGEARWGLASATLSGGDGDDRLEARGVLQLTLSGGAGKDVFVLTAQQYQAQMNGVMQFRTQEGWTDVAARPMEITDFKAGRGGEKLDVRDLLQNGASNYDGTNPFKTGHLDVAQSGADTLLRFDADGSGDNYVTLAVLRNVKATDLVADNFSPMFGTPNGDLMSGLGGSKPHYGLGSNDFMLSMDAPTDNPNWDANWESIVDAAPVVVEDNILDGGEGADVMAAGGGDDAYYVDDSGDVVREVAGQGVDTVITTINYTLSGNVENLVVGAGAAKGAKGVGNSANNTMRANDKGNELVGGGGNDQIYGGKGNDKLYAGSGNDYVDAGEGDDEIVGGDGEGDDTYSGGSGIDLIRYTSAKSPITVNLQEGYAFGADIGSDVLTGIENIIGGQVDDIIVGSSVANVIDGYTGADTMVGGDGDDTYYVDNVGDVVTETNGAASGGTDAIISTVTRTLGDYQENLTLSGTAAISGAGNALNNVLTGNDAVNVLDGGAGADTMIGGDGDDTYYVDNVGDMVSETNADGATGGTDLVFSSLSSYTLGVNVENGRVNTTGAGNLTGNGLNNVVYAGAGDNVLDGGAGVDTLSYAYGLATGATTGVTINLSLTTAQATGGSGFDTIANFENLEGSSFADTLTGNAAANTLDGAGGADVLVGLGGDDVYRVDITAAGALQDTVTEAADGGTDTIRLRGASTNTTAATITISANVENLDASGTGSSRLNLTGSAANNVLTGNVAANVLNGGTGADVMIGGDGSDTYYVDNAGDVVSETNADAATGGVDFVMSSLGNYTLGANVENGRVTTTLAANLTGNGLDNVIYAGAGANVLDGGAAVDTLSYAYGLVSGATSGVTVNLSLTAAQATGSSGSDTIRNFENLEGSSFADKLTGDSAANVITGGAGADAMDGGDGSDIYVIASAADYAAGEAIADTGTVGSSADEVRFAATTASTLTLNALLSGVESVVVGTGTAAAAVTTGTSAINVDAAAVGYDHWR